jgi:hypothetical protein
MAEIPGCRLAPTRFKAFVRWMAKPMSAGLIWESDRTMHRTLWLILKGEIAPSARVWCRLSYASLALFILLLGVFGVLRLVGVK